MNILTISLFRPSFVPSHSHRNLLFDLVSSRSQRQVEALTATSFNCLCTRIISVKARKADWTKKITSEGDTGMSEDDPILFMRCYDSDFEIISWKALCWDYFYNNRDPTLWAYVMSEWRAQILTRYKPVAPTILDLEIMLFNHHNPEFYHWPYTNVTYTRNPPQRWYFFREGSSAALSRSTELKTLYSDPKLTAQNPLRVVYRPNWTEGEAVWPSHPIQKKKPRGSGYAIYEMTYNCWSRVNSVLSKVYDVKAA